MIIITYKPGQLGNLLFLYSKFIAFSLEYNVKIKNPSFYQYLHYFKNTNAVGIPVFPKQKSFFNITLFRKQRYYLWYYFARIIYKLKINNSLIKCIYLDWHEQFDLIKNKHLLNAKIVFVQGWQFNAKQLINKYRPQIINYFKPTEKYSKNVAQFLRPLKTTNHFLIGVHIRHGDYATFEGGKYFYSFQKYANFMRQVQKLFDNKKVVFIICSNAKLDSKYFSEFNYSFGPNHELEDMLVLSKCDYIIGPPSTYTMWASFYGNTPLAIIQLKEHIINKTDFKIYNE